MSNYIKTVNFAAKDALASGNPAKVAKGTEVDTEFNNIATAIASKEDVANKGVSSGYAGLDGSARVAKANLPTDTAYLGTAQTWTALQTHTPSSSTRGIQVNATTGQYGIGILGAATGTSNGLL